MKKIADTCDSVWSYVGCYRWNAYRKHKNVHTVTYNNFVIKKITYYLYHFLQRGATVEYLESCLHSNIVLIVNVVPIGFSANKYCTKNTGMKYVSKYNFYKMTQIHTQIHTWIIYDGMDVCHHEELEEIRDGFSLSYPYFRHFCHSECAPAYLSRYSPASHSAFRSRSRKPTSWIKINGAFSRVSAHEARRHRRHFSHETPRTRRIP